MSKLQTGLWQQLVHNYTNTIKFQSNISNHSNYAQVVLCCALLRSTESFASCSPYLLLITSGAVYKWVQPPSPYTTPMRHAPHPCTNTVSPFKPTHLVRRKQLIWLLQNVLIRYVKIKIKNPVNSTCEVVLKRMILNNAIEIVFKGEM